MAIPMRMCCVCREKKLQNEMFRVIKTNRNTFEISEWKQHIFGRSAYICKSKDCLNNLSKKRALNRAFKCEVPQKIYEDLTKNT